jgi:hypothetical protein
MEYLCSHSVACIDSKFFINTFDIAATFDKMSSPSQPKTIFKSRGTN